MPGIGMHDKYKSGRFYSLFRRPLGEKFGCANTYSEFRAHQKDEIFLLPIIMSRWLGLSLLLAVSCCQVLIVYGIKTNAAGTCTVHMHD